MTATTTSKVVETFRQLARFPSPAGVFGRQTDLGFEIETLWTQRDLEKKESTKFLKNYLMPGAAASSGPASSSSSSSSTSNSSSIIQVGRPVDVTSELWRVYSKSGDRIAILRKCPPPPSSGDKEKEEKQMIEVWSRSYRLATVDVAAQEKHAKVYADDHVFGSFQFSDCEKYLLYIAEKKKPKFETFFDPFGKSSASKSDQTSSSSSSSAAPSSKKAAVKGEKYTYVEEWGEQLVGKSRPVICILNVASGLVKVLDDDVDEAGRPAAIPSSVSPGQAVWVPSVASFGRPAIVFVGFDHSVERLGIIYCPMRASRLYYLDLEEALKETASSSTGGEAGSSSSSSRSQGLLSDGGAATKKQKVEGAASLGQASTNSSAPLATPFGPIGVSVRSPRFAPDGGRLAFLSNPAVGPHHQCAKLMSVDFDGGRFPAETMKTIVDVVDSPRYDDSFQGIYAVALPRRCWDAEGRIWMNTVNDCYSRRLMVEPETGRWRGDEGSCLGVFGDFLVTSTSAGRLPPALRVSGVSGVSGAKPLNAAIFGISQTEEEENGRPGNPLITAETYVYSDLQPTVGPPIHYSAILHFPPAESAAESAADAGKCPLIVFPHGGPHSAFLDEWMLFVSGFLQLGFAVLKVNYRGSVGRGQASIDSLPGHVGVHDVEDVHEAALHALRVNPSRLDPSRVCVFGGSHGGFLTAHLIGQYPDFYKVAVCRNPVINLANMFGVTDIPDWTFVEGVTGGAAAYSAGVVPTAEQYADLISRSPISHAHKVKCPTLLLVGMKDLRVPPNQGVQFYKALKARGVATELKTFPDDCHSLSKVETEAECFVLVVNWYLKHLGLLLPEEEGEGDS